MITFLIAFFLTLTPSPTDSFVTPYTIAFAVEAPALAITAPAPVTAAVKPAIVKPIAPAAIPTPAVPVVATPAAPASSLFGAGGLLDPARLGTITLGQTSRLSADQVVSKVQDFYKDTKHLKAKFRQTVRNETFGKESVSDGWVYIKKPGKMRWDYASKKNKKKVSKSFISDGESIWAVFLDDLQYYKKSVKDDLLPVAITFLSGKGDLSADFTAALDSKSGYGKKGDYVVKLSPKKPNAQYSNLWLVVDAKTYRVRQSIVLNSKKDTNRFAFHEGDTSKAIKDSVFVFNEKKNKKFKLVNPEKKK